MKIKIEIELGAEDMQSRIDVFQAIRQSLLKTGGPDRLAPLLEGEKASIYGVEQGEVGHWEVTE